MSPTRLDWWWPWYKGILKEFAFSRKRDQKAADLLSSLLRRRYLRLSDLRATVRSRPVIVFGAGPSVEQNLSDAEGTHILEKFITICADGATTAYLKVCRFAPDIIVTDLDGRIPHIVSACTQGSKIVVHAHGDNMPEIKRHVPKLTRALGTTQANPRQRVHNFGGFTDGDRAVFMAAALEAKAVVLGGMDFGRSIGKYSKLKVKSPIQKLRKLEMGRQLLEFFAARSRIPLYNITGRGRTIRGFRAISVEKLDSI